MRKDLGTSTHVEETSENTPILHGLAFSMAIICTNWVTIRLDAGFAENIIAAYSSKRLQEQDTKLVYTLLPNPGPDS